MGLLYGSHKNERRIFKLTIIIYYNNFIFDNLIVTAKFATKRIEYIMDLLEFILSDRLFYIYVNYNIIMKELHMVYELRRAIYLYKIF